MSPDLPLRFDAATDVGKVREHNEDNFFVDKRMGLFVVADGMGGHAAGEVASARAVHSFHEELKKHVDDLVVAGTNQPSENVKKILDLSVQHATASVFNEAAADPAKRGMGTTFSALLIIGHYAFITHVGDSRIYLRRNGSVAQITEDHTVENDLIRHGKLTEEQIGRIKNKNAITRAVGVYERVEPDIFSLEVLPGDTFLLSSDGLTGYLASADELGSYLALPGPESVRALIELANSRGGKDNITTIIIRVAEGVTDEARANRIARTREVLAKMPLFSHLNEREILRVMQVAFVRKYADAEVVIQEGTKGEELYIILSGSLRVLRGDQLITQLGQGAHVGEMALLRSTPRSATVRAEGETQLIVLRRTDFFELLRADSIFAVKLLWQFLGIFADRLDTTSSDLSTARRELEEVRHTQQDIPAFKIPQ